jgi:hypothetical protein
MTTQPEADASPPERMAFSIEQFCARNGIGVSTYHKLKRQGRGPVEMRLGPCTVRVSIEEEKIWREARSHPAKAEAKVVAAAAAKLVARGRYAGRLAVQSPRHVANKRRQRAAR